MSDWAKACVALAVAIVVLAILVREAGLPISFSLTLFSMIVPSALAPMMLTLLAGQWLARRFGLSAGWVLAASLPIAFAAAYCGAAAGLWLFLRIP
jgi:hypothetical protein